MAEERDPDRITDRVDQVDLQVEMQRSYLDYAMSGAPTGSLCDV
jgi:DNA gyrase subunit A